LEDLTGLKSSIRLGIIDANWLPHLKRGTLDVAMVVVLTIQMEIYRDPIGRAAYHYEERRGKRSEANSKERQYCRPDVVSVCNLGTVNILTL